jgi:hypothetical protein
MKNITSKSDSSQPAAKTAVYLFDDWFDPIEAGVRDRVREFIHAMVEGELDAALMRPRYGRRSQSSSGCRRAGWCHRPPAWPSFTFADGHLRADRNRGSARPARRPGWPDDGVEEQDTAGLSAPHAGRRCADCKYIPRRHQHAPGPPSARGAVRRCGRQGHGKGRNVIIEFR